MIFHLYTGTSALIIYISYIQGTKKYSAVMYYCELDPTWHWKSDDVFSIPGPSNVITNAMSDVFQAWLATPSTTGEAPGKRNISSNEGGRKKGKSQLLARRRKKENHNFEQDKEEKGKSELWKRTKNGKSESNNWCHSPLPTALSSQRDGSRGRRGKAKH